MAKERFGATDADLEGFDFGNHLGRREFKKLVRTMGDKKYSQSVNNTSAQKKGGKFQQGGQVDTNDPRTQIIGLVQAAMQGDQQAQETISQIQQAAQQGNEQAAQILQMIQEVVNELQQESQQEAGANAAGVPMARYGAKLSYIKKLKGECAEGEEAYYYKIGGKICKKCQKVKKNNCGAKVKSAKKGCSAAVTDFRNSRQKHQEGGVLNIAPEEVIDYATLLTPTPMPLGRLAKRVYTKYTEEKPAKDVAKAQVNKNKPIKKSISEKPIEGVVDGRILVSGGEKYSWQPGETTETLSGNGYKIRNVYPASKYDSNSWVPIKEPLTTDTLFFYPNGNNIGKHTDRGGEEYYYIQDNNQRLIRIPDNSGRQHYQRERSKYVKN